MGGRPPESTDRLGEEELVVLSLIEMEHSLNFVPHTIEQTLRVYGESLRRIAETESEMFRSEIARPLTSSGGTVTDLSQFVAEYSPILTKLTDQALLAIYHRQQRHTWSVNIIDAFSSALEEAGMHEHEGGNPGNLFPRGTPVSPRSGVTGRPPTWQKRCVGRWRGPGHPIGGGLGRRDRPAFQEDRTGAAARRRSASRAPFGVLIGWAFGIGVGPLFTPSSSTAGTRSPSLPFP